VSGKIVELMQPEAQHDLAWLRQSLQAAIELELATIPPYLCGLWSIKAQGGPAYDLIDSVVLEEMLHMGLVCNMLTAIGGTPQIVAGYQQLTYPGPLPGGVRPKLMVYLGGLTKDYLGSVYMEIEFPEKGPVALAFGEEYPTIGAFYDAISSAFEQLAPPMSTKNQLISEGISLTKVGTVADAVKAITEIKEQGEGTSQSPLATDFGGELAHYYRFAEIFNGKKLIQVGGKWNYSGDPIPFPDVYPMTPVPAGGYPNPSSQTKQALQAFNQKFATVLNNLESAWTNGNQNDLSKAVGTMLGLQSLANSLMQIPRVDQNGVYGPEFRLP